MALNYSKWDDLYDSDEERKKEKRAEEEKRKADARARALKGPSKPPPMPGGMTEQQFADQYAKMFKNGRQGKQPYKFPETLEEQKAKCDEAEELKRRGNEYYKQGELVEAAKMYEQAVLKFADWFALAWATDEEKAMVHAVKLPAHNNLANCSFRLGNHQHAVVHSSQVLEHEPRNVKALYRRGASQLRLGYLEKAREDLQLAAKLARPAPSRRAAHTSGGEAEA